MKSFPILFRFREPIMGRGFVAFVATDGRALLTEEEDGYWFYGVNPGGIAGGGKSRSEAFREFQKSYLSVLFDIAAESPSFEDFRTEAERFLTETNKPSEAEWVAAHDAVKRGDLAHPDLERVKIEDRPTTMTIIQVGEQGERSPEPSLNKFDEFAAAA